MSFLGGSIPIRGVKWSSGHLFSAALDVLSHLLALTDDRVPCIDDTLIICAPQP